MTDPAFVVAVLRQVRFRVSTEAALQASIEEALAPFPFEREARLGPGERVDFLVDGSIGIEAKTRAAKRPIYMQLRRYARHETISALILVTGTAMGMPSEIDGKPVYYVSIGRGAL
jgi:hypothetical protein